MTQADSDLWSAIRRTLEERGIELDALGCEGESDPQKIKVVCIAPGMSQSLRELGATTRDQVVMMRVDEETSRALDDWVETGIVRSRSEAAALLIREGLKVRAAELEELRDALRDVERARERLRKKARDVFAGDAEADADGADS